METYSFIIISMEDSVKSFFTKNSYTSNKNGSKGDNGDEKGNSDGSGHGDQGEF